MLFLGPCSEHEETTYIPPTPEEETSTINPPEGYHLVWHDEFDNGTTLGSDWTHEVQGPGWVNNELQTYVDGKTSTGKRVTELKDGKLHISCFKENGTVYSGRVYAKVNEGWQSAI